MNALATSGATNGQFPVSQPLQRLQRHHRSPEHALDEPPRRRMTGPTAATVAGPRAYPLQYTFNTPVGQTNQCGRVIFSDFHVTAPSGGSSNFPNECDMNPMSPQEKALEYLIWDLASCVPAPPSSTCTPRSCAQQNIGCGPAGDGCGNELQCGPCAPPQTCGGGGVSGQCGNTDATACVPLTCAQQNIGCGPAGDGCGNPDPVRPVHLAGDVRRWRGVRAVRADGKLHAGDMRPAEHQLRPGGRWMRQPHPVRTVRVTGDVRGRRRVRSVRHLGRRQHMHAEDMPAARCQLRTGRRRVRRAPQLRKLHRPADLRRRRDAGDVRRRHAVGRLLWGDAAEVTARTA